MSLDKNWQEVEWVAFDTETTGKYPVESEICELAAVKWRAGEIVDQFESLFSVSKPMSEEVIKIHGITNEMLEGKPKISEKLGEFVDFIGDGYLLAHHAPFDLGFLAVEFEKNKMDFLSHPAFCTSLLSRKLIPESPNHRLQTLVNFLGIPPRKAHRALSDAEACLDVGIKCFEVFGGGSLKDMQSAQGKNLIWPAFSIEALKEQERFADLVNALQTSTDVSIKYSGGSRPGKERTVFPIGIVRNPGQDFLVALSSGDSHPKRYYLNRILSSQQ